MENFRISHAHLMYHVHENIQLAMAFANIAKNAESDYVAMDADFCYAEHMAHAMFYLTHARNLRLRRKSK